MAQIAHYFFITICAASDSGGMEITMQNLQNYKMTIAYDGRRYMGFTAKKESSDKSIQGKIEAILEKLCSKPVEVIGAVHTDAGVHAKQQVIHFAIDKTLLELADLKDYFEKYLPDDIITLNLEYADERFHSKYLAQQITYEYRLWKQNAVIRPLFERQYVNVMNQYVDVSKMKEAAIDFIGEFDFAAFTTHSKARNTVKKVKSVKISETENEITITITANGFLLNMERLMVGTLIQVGLGQLPMHAVEHALDKQDPKFVGHKVSAGALCLTQVAY